MFLYYKPTFNEFNAKSLKNGDQQQRKKENPAGNAF